MSTAPQQPSTASMLEVRNLSVRFGRQTILRDINLSVARSETVAIIGESGCGKTVLLKTMIGLIKPTSGQILFDDRDLASFDEKQLSRQRIRYGFVFQNAALFDSLTVGQNIAFPLREHTNHSNSKIQELVFRALADVGLPDHVVARKPAELSGGMRKRVGLARARILNPELMLYDEPTTGLDPIMSDVINELIIHTRHGGGISSVLVTHDMHSARKVADRIVMLYPVSRLRENESQILFDGPPSMIDRVEDRRVTQFVRGEAGERLMELRERGGGNEWTNES